MSAARSASRSIVRRTNRSYPSNGSNHSTRPAASASSNGRRSMTVPAWAAMTASIAGSMSDPAAAPVGDFTLNPLSVHGLCEAVMTIPAAAPRCTTSYELICVGTAVTLIATGMSRASSTSAAARAKCSEANLRSYATITPFACSPRSATYVATPSAMRRTLSNVKSSAMRARQPSVPNTILVGVGVSAWLVTHGPPLQHTDRAGPARANVRPGPRAGGRSAGRD